MTNQKYDHLPFSQMTQEEYDRRKLDGTLGIPTNKSLGNTVERSGATEQRNDGWISVKDRLPLLPDEVLVFFNTDEYTVGFYCNGEWDSYYIDTGVGFDVSHWQHLPPPPKTD